MRPLTDTRPKHLLPVGGVPLLDLLVDRLCDLGVQRLALAVSVHAEQIEAHLDARANHLAARGISWIVSREPQPLGTGGAVVTAARLLSAPDDEPLLVVNGDLLTGHDLAAQARLLDPGTDVVLHVRPAADPSPFGTVVCAQGGVVQAFQEKVPGPPGTLVNAGTYVLRAGVLGPYEPGAPCSWERDVLPGLLDRGVRARAYEEDAWFADVGSPQALVTASVAALTGAANAALPRDYRPARPRDVVLEDGATVTPDVSLGRRVRVHEAAVVRGSVLLDDVEVAQGAVVTGSVLGDGVRVGRGARIEGCAVGDHVTVDEGAVLSGLLPTEEG